MKKVLVTGSNGQLGSCIRHIAPLHSDIQFLFTDFEELNISDALAVNGLFEKQHFDFCINCAAYTAVDKAEVQKKACYEINAEGPKILAEACKTFDSTFIHISTDFVFDGQKTEPYTEQDAPNPLNVYGMSKLKGEEYVKNVLAKYFVVRTSWIYSEYGNNFMKTMLRLGRERNEISVVDDQVGSPTYARDLAQFLVHLIDTDEKAYGLYNYSNEGEISWFDFASEIFKLSGINVKLNPIKSEAYPTPATRPKNSTLNKAKAMQSFQIEIPFWRDSLRNCFSYINSRQEDGI